MTPFCDQYARARDRTVLQAGKAVLDSLPTIKRATDLPRALSSRTVACVTFAAVALLRIVAFALVRTDAVAR